MLYMKAIKDTKRGVNSKTGTIGREGGKRK